MTGEIKFDHAIYDTFTYQKGANLAVKEEAFKNLLQSADTALGKREPGYFFEVIGDRFVFGFENQRHDEHSRGGSMAFFDLYAADADEVRDVPLSDLYEFFTRRRVDSFTTDISPAVTYRPAGDTGTARQGESDNGWSSTGGGTDDWSKAGETDDWSGTDDEWEESGSAVTDPDSQVEASNGGWPSVDSTTTESTMPADEERDIPEATLDTLADIWEHCRRADGDPVPVTFSEMETIVDTVDGTLSAVSFVSESRGDPSYFDLVGGEREKPLAYDALVDYLRLLADNGQLSWGRLPSYQDEIDKIQQRAGNRLATDSRDRMDPGIDAAFEDARSELNAMLDRYLDEVSVVVSDAVDGTLSSPDAKDQNLLGRVGGVFSGGSNQDDIELYVERARTRFRNSQDFDKVAVDERTEHLVLEHVVRLVAGDLQESIEEEVLNTLEAEIADALEDEAVLLAEQSVKGVNTVLASESYRLAEDSDDSE